MKLLLEEGIDDLRHGVEQLLTNCSTEAAREAVADMIVREIEGIADDAPAVQEFVLAVGRFAYYGTFPDHVRRTFGCFVEEVWPIIHRRNQAKINASKGRKVSAKRARDALDFSIEQELEKMMKAGLKLPAFDNVEKMAEALRFRLPRKSVREFRRGLERRKDIHFWVESRPPKSHK